MPSFRWLHISDWHQRKGKDRQDREAILHELQEDVKSTMSRFDKISEIDAIIFSGDIAFSGQEEEYALANTHLIEPLRKIIGLHVPIFFVAGNHDIDWKTVEATLPNVFTRLHRLSDKEREKALANPEDIVEFKRPFAEFYKFASRHGQVFSADGLHSVMTVPLKRGAGEAGNKKV